MTADPREHDRRTVYLIAKRNLRLPFMEVFDQPDLQTSCARRESSTHAPQALELLNGELANDLADGVRRPAAARSGRRSATTDRPRLPARRRPPADRARTTTRPRIPREPAARGVRPGDVQPERVPVCRLNADLTLRPRSHPCIAASLYDRASREIHSLPARRAFLRDAFCGFGSLALASLLAQTSAGRRAPIRSPPSRRRSAPKAKSVIFLFMAGGPSHLETFDPKPLLNQLNGQPRPGGVRRGEVPVRPARRPAARHASARSRKYGQSGIEVSDLFPHTAQCIDDIAVIRSCHGDMVVHSAAQYELFTGRIAPGFPEHGLVGRLRPRLRERVAAGLRRDARSRRRARSRPADVHATASCRPSISRRCSAPAHSPVRNLDLPAGRLARSQRRKTVELIRELNEATLAAGDDEFAARIAAYDLAFRMQTEAPEVFDLSGETQETLDLYGVGHEPTDDYGRRCLLARRLVEQGVRFVCRRLRRRPGQHAVGRPQRHRGEPPAHGRRDRPAGRRPARPI